jgi:hydrogenase maturation protease
MSDGRTLIIGIGNPYRQDDGAGIAAARRLKEMGFRVEEQNGEGAALIEAWTRADRVILIDAVSSGAPPGTLHRFDATSRRLPKTPFRRSTHAFGVAEAVELARSLHRLPRRLIVYGIEGKRFGTGDGVSPDVANQVDQLVAQMTQEIEALGQTDA